MRGDIAQLTFLMAMLLVSAAINVGDQLVSLVVHIESKRSGHTQNWVVRSDYADKDWGHYTRLAPYSNEEVISAEKSKWLVHDCNDGYICFESVEYVPNEGMYYRDRYLEAHYPSGGDEQVVLLFKDYQYQEASAARWKVECEASDMQKCTLVSERWPDLFMCTQWIKDLPKGATSRAPAGYYITQCNQSDIKYFHIYAPPPTDTQSVIYEGTNDGTVTTDPYKKTFTIGMQYSKSSTETITESTSMEVGASFKMFSSGVSETVSKEWSTTSSMTYSASVTTSYTFTIPPKTHMTVTQLHGSYGNVLDIYSENYVYHYEDLDSGVVTKKKKRAILNPENLEECEMKEEL